MKAVIMAAGYGSRFLPFSKAVSKVMLPIIDTPTIQLIVEEAIESGIEEILIIVGSNKEAIIKHFSEDKKLLHRVSSNDELYEIATKTCYTNVKFIEQKVLDGTGSGMLLAKKFVNNEPFLLMFADDLMIGNGSPVSKQMIDLFNKTGKTILGCQHVEKKDIVQYSSVEYSKKSGRVYTVTRIVEKPKLEEVTSTLSTLGRYILKPNIFEACRNLKPTKKGEKIITDAYDILARQGDVIAYNFDGVRYDIGNKLGYLTAIYDFATKNEQYGKDFIKYVQSKNKR